jgi:serine/threonine protein kinase
MDWEAFYNHFRQPDFIPGYEIQNRLGGGAFGEVYKARKASIGKAYAIKFLKIDDDAQREAVERELEQVRHFAAIDHPNLVTIEDLGTVNGVPYLIMGYAGEDTLARALKSGRLDPQAAFLYFVQACRGVLALHDRRLVHFDLKPSNIFLKGEIARVGDYGLSKMMTDGRLTLSFGRGTPQYMAPEMLKNRADHRADVYSLGVILYESLSGKLPFESAVPGTISVREDDTSPQFSPEFPAPMRRVVERCLRLAPQDRYASVSELLEDLGQTARPGESLRMESARPGSSTIDPKLVARDKSTPLGDRPGPRTEARQAAAELTRGAVEVARGVWDGLRNIRTAPRTSSDPRLSLDPRSPPTPRPPSDARPGSDAPRSAPGSTPSAGKPGPVVGGEWSSDADLDPKRATGTPPFAPTPAAQRPDGAGAAAPDTLVMYSLDEGMESAARGTSLGVPPVIESGAASALAGTIPVPPAGQGGWLGTLRSSLVLAVEVLVSLLRGLVRKASGGTARNAAHSIGAGVWRMLRVLGFVLLLALLGGLVTWVAILVLKDHA